MASDYVLIKLITCEITSRPVYIVTNVSSSVTNISVQ